MARARASIGHLPDNMGFYPRSTEDLWPQAKPSPVEDAYMRTRRRVIVQSFEELILEVSCGARVRQTGWASLDFFRSSAELLGLLVLALHFTTLRNKWSPSRRDNLFRCIDSVKMISRAVDQVQDYRNKCARCQDKGRPGGR